MTDQEGAHLLNDGELRQLFDRDIRPTIDGPAQDTPRLLILGGPQGSGKTSALSRVAEQLGYSEAVRVDGDDLFYRLPAFDPLARQHGALEAAKRCNPNWQRLWEWSFEEARAQRRDVIAVGPYTNVEATEKTIKSFTSVGYRAEAAYMAVHPARSQLGVAHRHHQAMTDGVGYSFAIPLKLQQLVYENTPSMMAAAQERELVEALHIADRSGLVLSTTRQPDGRWEPPVDVKRAVETHRALPWSNEVREDFIRRREAVGGSLAEAEWAERLSSIDRLASPMLGDTLDAEARASARLAALAFPQGAEAAVSNSTPAHESDSSPTSPDRSPSSDMER